MSTKYDIITIGSATRDIYLEGDAFIPVVDKSFGTGAGICVNLGSKVDVTKLHLTTGGSALNAAVTFARQGLQTAIIANVGRDEHAEAIRKRLSEEGIADEFIQEDADELTATSVLIHSPDGERSIFVYRGASAHLTPEEVNVPDILSRTKWIYMTHMAAESQEVFEQVMEGAKDAGVRVAINPGSTQLNMGEGLMPFLKNVSILFVNQEEAAKLTGTDYKNENEVFAKLDSWVDGIVVMTKGKDGVTVSDGTKHYSAPTLPDAGLVDRTGAGDAFGSGFTSVIAKGGTIEEAIQLGSANATGVITQWGANQGLLAPGDAADTYGVLNINVTPLS